jgi:hypothetical protein
MDASVKMMGEGNADGALPPVMQALMDHMKNTSDHMRMTAEHLKQAAAPKRVVRDAQGRVSHTEPMLQ